MEPTNVAVEKIFSDIIALDLLLFQIIQNDPVFVIFYELVWMTDVFINMQLAINMHFSMSVCLIL